MNTGRILGIVILVIGVVLLAVGHHASNAPVDQITNSFTGRYTDQTMWYLLVGGAAIVGGGLLAVFGAQAPR